MKRYSAKLLFQYRAALGENPNGIMRCCEERLILVSARTARAALSKAKAHGKKAERKGKGEAGNTYYFDFIGVMDLLEIGIECEPDEVWYDIRTRKLPMERKEKLIPPEEKLNAIFWENEAKRGTPTKGSSVRGKPRR